MRDVLLLLHLLGAFSLAAGTAAMAPFALRLGAAGLERVDAARLARIGAVFSNGGAALTLAMGLWLVGNGGYELLRFWLIAAFVLFGVAGFGNSKVAAAAKDPEASGVKLLWAIDTAATVLLLALMIYKPGH